MNLKKIYFIGNWKMNGSAKDIKQIHAVKKYVSKKQNNKIEVVFCPPVTLLLSFCHEFKNKIIKIGAQDCSDTDLDYGAATGSISCKQIKDLGSKYIIIGHSERRANGDDDKVLSSKILNAYRNNLKIIFCIGESLNEFKKNIAFKKIKSQINNVFSKNRKILSKVIIAYEPVWSIGTGMVPKLEYLNKIFLKLHSFLKSSYKYESPLILYGGSVSKNNMNELKNVTKCSGFLIGGASLKSKNFIDILKKYYN